MYKWDSPEQEKEAINSGVYDPKTLGTLYDVDVYMAKGELILFDGLTAISEIRMSVGKRVYPAKISRSYRGLRFVV